MRLSGFEKVTLRVPSHAIASFMARKQTNTYGFLRPDRDPHLQRQGMKRDTHTSDCGSDRPSRLVRGACVAMNLSRYETLYTWPHYPVPYLTINLLALLSCRERATGFRPYSFRG